MLVQQLSALAHACMHANYHMMHIRANNATCT